MESPSPSSSSADESQQKPPLGRRFRPLIIAGVICLIIIEVVALSPSSLEQSPPSKTLLSEESLLPAGGEEKVLATGIPTGKVPDYSVDGFNYVSTRAGQKQWKLVARRAFLYNGEKLVHSRRVTAYLYDADNKITVVEGKEAKYFMDQKDLEIYGDVWTTFPDGFKTQSEYLKYQPSDRRIEIPTRYEVHGQGDQLNFDSQGLEFAMDRSKLILPQAVKVVMTKPVDTPTDNAGVAEKTTVESDRCIIDRKKQIAYFTMYDSRPLKTRFVQIRQPGMYARSRRTDMHYGDFSKILNYITAYEDVLIQEIAKPGQSGKSEVISSFPNSARNGGPPTAARPNQPHPKEMISRYATGGRADFDTQRNVIVLKEFPQVYQENDTVTGDVIIVHRDTDIVEVEHSNAYSAGEDQGK
jgi:LPS export ABC transporter protein LptC